MKIIKFKLLKNFKLLSLIFLSLINLNFSMLYGLHMPSFGEHKHAATGASAAGSDVASDGSRAGAGSAVGGAVFKSRSEGDLSSLLTRTVARIDILEPKFVELEKTQQEHGKALGKIDSLLVQDGSHIKSLEELRDQVRMLETKVGTESELLALRARETVRDSLKVPVATVVDGSSTTVYMRLSPDSKRAYELKLHSLETNYESALARARGPQQDDTHADDKKFMEDTMIGEVIADAGEGAARVAEKLTPAKMVAAAAATGLAVWLVKRRT